MKFLAENLRRVSFGAIFALIFSFFLITFVPAHASDEKRIDINISTQTLTLYQGKKAVGSYKISSGKKSTPTPRGKFQIYNKASRAWSEEYKLYMPYWMAFTPSGSYGIHELPQWPDGTKEGAGHLGIPVSHGCVRLGVGPAKTVYFWAPIGTPVLIH